MTAKLLRVEPHRAMAETPQPRAARGATSPRQVAESRELVVAREEPLHSPEERLEAAGRTREAVATRTPTPPEERPEAAGPERYPATAAERAQSPWTAA